MSSSRPHHRPVILFIMMILVVTACFCTWTPSIVCFSVLGEDGMPADDPKLLDCQQYVNNACGGGSYANTAGQVSYEQAECHRNAANDYLSLGSGGAACASFKLTSPLDGMNNGFNTFYWDPLPGATSYQLQVMESNVVRASFNVPGTQTSLVANVSTGAIGQGSMFLIRIRAFTGTTEKCKQDTFILRGAPNNPAPLPPQPPSQPPTPQPSCNFNRQCEPNLGESRNSCPRDCR